MIYRALGKTSVEVSQVGFGGWGIGKQLWKGGDDEQSKDTLRAALEASVNFFDTALAYGHGHSERLIGQVLREARVEAFVATKIPPLNMAWPARGTLLEAFPEEHLRRCVGLSLENLERDSLDLVQLHVWNPDWMADGSWFECLEHLRSTGQIRFIGVSANDHEPDSVIELVESGLVDTVQVIYNIFDQSAADRLFDVCLRRRVGVIVRVPFDEGALTGNVTRQTRFPKKDFRNVYFDGARRKQLEPRVDALRELLGEETETLPELALRFCLSHPAVSSVIPGMRSPRHVELNVGVAEKGAISEDLIERLRAHRWNKNFYQRA